MKRLIQIVSVMVLLAACNVNASETTENHKETIVVKKVETTSPNEAANRVMAMRFYEEVVNAHNVDAIDLFAADNYLEHQYDTHYDSDRKGIKKAFNEYFKAFPDMHVKVNFMVVEGEFVTAQITTTGTNTGPIYGQNPTMKKFEINGVDIIRFKNGKVEEHWGYAEEGKLLTQLGLIRPLFKEGLKARKDAARRKEVKVFPGSADGKPQ